jgi:hypothetical protein
LRPGVFNVDESTVATMAMTMRSGGRLYHSVVDRKPPVLPFLYDLMQRITHSGDLRPMRVVSLLAVAATSVILVGEGRRRYGEARVPWQLVALPILAFVALPPEDAQAVGFELIAVLPATVGFVLAARGRVKSGAAATAVATLCKQTFALGLIPVLYLAARRHGARAVVASLAVFFGIVVVTGVLLGWSDFMYWVFTGTTGYTSVDLSSIPEVARIAAGMTALLTLSFAGPLLLASAGRRRELDVELWLASSVIAFLVGFRFLGHYAIQVLPPLTLMALQGCAAGGRRLRWGIGLTVVSAMVWVGLAFVPQHVQPMPNYQYVVSYVDAHSSSTDRVFVWGESSELYWSSERLPASRFPHIQFLTDLSPGRANEAPKYDTNSTRAAWTDLWSDFVQHPPKLILDTTKVDGGAMQTAHLESSPLASYLRASFQPVAVLDGVTVYARSAVGVAPSGDGPLPSSIRLGNHPR